MRLFDWGQSTPMSLHEAAQDTARRNYRFESDIEGARFSASLQAWWLPEGANCDGRVFQYVSYHGNKVTRGFSVLDRAAANDALNAWFAVQRTIPDSGIELLSVRAELTVADDILESASRIAEIQRRASIEATDLQAKHTHFMRLRDLFLSDAGMARLWWLNGDPDRLLSLVEHTSDFDQTVNMIAGSQNGGGQPDRIAPIVDHFLRDLGPSHREYLIGQIERVFVSYGQPHLAAELRSTQS